MYVFNEEEMGLATGNVEDRVHFRFGSDGWVVVLQLQLLVSSGMLMGAVLLLLGKGA